MENSVNVESATSVHWSGIDVSKLSFDASLVLEGHKYPSTPLRDIPAQKFARTKEGARAFIAWLDDLLDKQGATGVVRVVMESTGKYSEELAVWLLGLRSSLRPAIVNPYATAKYIESLGVRTKTDRLEARALGFYGIEREPAPYEPPSPILRKLRDLNRYRDVLVCERTANKNRAQEQGNTVVVRQIHKRRRRQLDRDIARIEKEMAKLVDKDPQLRRDVARLSTIYGVAFLTAVTVRAELGDLRRFRRARQLCAFAGLSPRIHESGSSVRGRTKLCKRGNSRARRALYLAAMTVIRGHSELQETYVRLCEQGKSHKAALGAVMRKLLTVMRAMLIYEQDYSPMWKTSGKTEIAGS